MVFSVVSGMSSSVTVRLAVAVALVAVLTVAVLVAIGALGAPEAHACAGVVARAHDLCF